MIDFLTTYWPMLMGLAAIMSLGVRLYLGHERRIRDLEEARSIIGHEGIRNFEDHATIKTTLGILEVKVDRSAEAVNSLVLYLKLKDKE